MKGLYPKGNGFFIWLIDRAAGKGTLDDLVSLVVKNNLWVAVKIADGIYPFFGNSDRRKKTDLVAQFVDRLRRYNVSVWGWHYVYGYLPTQEAQIAYARMRELDLDGYIIDAEVEYKRRHAEARQFLKTLKHDFPLALCTFRFPTYHTEFPFKEFLDVVDVNMPQVYWVGAQNSRVQLQRSYYEYKRFRQVPFVPVGAAYSEHGWSPTVYSIADFLAAVKDMGFPGCSWWEWYDAFVRHPEWGKAALGQVESETAPVSQRRVLTRYQDLRYRAEPSLAGKVLGYLVANRPYQLGQTQGTWGYLPELKGWVHLGYCTILG